MAGSYDRLSDDSTHFDATRLAEDDTRGENTNSWTFTWLKDLLTIAENRPLEQTDAPPLPKKCTTRFNSRRH